MAKRKMTTKQYSTCDICKFTTDHDEDILWNGEWLQKQSITVHYFCLLLSTYLPQRGGDSSGILGFLMRDIRNEAKAAAERTCVYCKKPHASISCAKCKCVFHLICGREQSCTSHFFDEFLSYCSECASIDDYKRELIEHPPKGRQCDICLMPIPIFTPTNVVYGDCCRKGFAHRLCMQRYALASGYYLRCIWCRKTDFREQIRSQSIFVPDRDATWEREKNAFSELYRKHKRCDKQNCLCPQGRDYINKTWSIVVCILCASYGAHRQCIAGNVRKYNKNVDIQFKCPTCLAVEQNHENVQHLRSTNVNQANGDNIDTSFYVHKTSTKIANTLVRQSLDETPTFSDEETTSNSSVITVIALQKTNAHHGKQMPQTPKQCIFPLPLQLKRAYNIVGQPYFYLEIYEFDRNLNCYGTCKLRFKADDVRISDKSQQALEQLLVKTEDIYERNLDRGIYNKIDQLIQEMQQNPANNGNTCY